MTTFTLANGYAWDNNDPSLEGLLDADVLTANSTTLRLDIGDGGVVAFTGSGLTYGADGVPNGGTVTRVVVTINGTQALEIKDFSIPATTWVAWASQGNIGYATLFAGADTIVTAGGDDLLGGFGGNDTIDSGNGADTVAGGDGADLIKVGGGSNAAVGGLGDDTLSAAESSHYNYLWAEDGNDSISGGSGFDNTHGNQGNDTSHGNDGNDWVVGGKGLDQMFGDAGDDLVYGNIGEDTLYGGDGADRLLGGQDSDTLSGEAGNDFLSGDRGADTISGGTGADIFYGFEGTGVDRITDFNYAEGDRVQLFQTTLQSVAVVGSDTVVSFGAANQLILVGVTTPLPADFLLTS